MFNYKTNKELAEMTSEEIDVYAKEKRAFEDAEQKTAIEKAVEEATKELTSKAEKEDLQNKVNDLADKLIDLETKGQEKEPMTIVKAVKEQITEIKDLVSGKGADVELKATVTRASIAGNTASYRLNDIGQLGVKRRALYDYFTKIPLGKGNHNGTITYVDWDEDTIARAAAVVAEGAQFPESEAAFIERSKKLVKIGDTLPVTEEFGEDEALAAAELDNFLRVNMNTVIDNKIAVGAGGVSDIEGLYTAAPTYTAVASGIQDANIKDLVRKMRTSIVKTRGSKYSPNFVAANSDTIDQYILKKDANNNYMFDMNTGQIAGLDIVEDNNLADGTLVVGDGRFGNIYEMSGVVLSEGLVNDQYTADMKTIKARTRLLFLIKEVDKTGFAKSTDISADLATLATPEV